MKLVFAALLLSGCTLGQANLYAPSTTVDPLPLRAGFRDDSLIIGVPLIVEPRKTGGWRSTLELRLDVKMLKSTVGNPLPTPNGFVFGPRLRW